MLVLGTAALREEKVVKFWIDFKVTANRISSYVGRRVRRVCCTCDKFTKKEQGSKK